jgi:hypothetical protein
MNDVKLSKEEHYHVSKWINDEKRGELCPFHRAPHCGDKILT